MRSIFDSPVAAPPEDWPYTELGRQNVRDYDEHESPQYECLPVGASKMTLYSYAINLKREGDADTAKRHVFSR